MAFDATPPGEVMRLSRTFARLGGELTDEFALAAAILVVLAWAAITLGAGLWRTQTQEI